MAEKENLAMQKIAWNSRTNPVISFLVNNNLDAGYSLIRSSTKKLYKFHFKTPSLSMGRKVAVYPLASFSHWKRFALLDINSFWHTFWLHGHVICLKSCGIIHHITGQYQQRNHEAGSKKYVRWAWREVLSLVPMYSQAEAKQLTAAATEARRI